MTLNKHNLPTRPPRRKQIIRHIKRNEIKTNSFLLLRFSTTAPPMVYTNLKLLSKYSNALSNFRLERNKACLKIEKPNVAIWGFVISVNIIHWQPCIIVLIQKLGLCVTLIPLCLLIMYS